MALIRCSECGRDVSSKATTCPHCGNPITNPSVADASMHGRGEGIFMKSMNCGCMVLLAFVALVVILMVIGASSR